ncbi:carbohydrate esterase family 5 protein, partial [Aulographum hederae CBS 113979]
CRPYILIYAKGTGEPGAFGISVGPMLRTALAANLRLDVRGVNYDASLAADFCFALPGGKVAQGDLEKAASQCPDAKFILSGYSQGGMVARLAVANTTPAIKARVVGVLTFGDPFNGSTIKGYTGPIQVFCAPTDGVCGGNFNIGAAHRKFT